MPNSSTGPAAITRTKVLDGQKTEPFHSVEQVWFWTMAALAARHTGARNSNASVKRPCDPDDILRSLDRLYRHRRIDLTHARIMRIWGERRIPPNPSIPRERCDSAIWREAMERLAAPLRSKGIIAG